jgi:isocitrate dehydrogenase kinase/phosphatase
MWIPTEQNRLARRSAMAIVHAFDGYERGFRAITRNARCRFESRDWRGLHADALARLDLYGRAVADVLAEIRGLLDASEKDPKLWATMKGVYAERIAGRGDVEVAETFFNSVSRRIFATIGVNPQIEFLYSEFDDLWAHESDTQPVERSFPASRPLAELIREILESYDFGPRFEDPGGDAAEVARRIEEQRSAHGLSDPIDAIDMIDAVFYRNQGAYLVGRIWCAERSLPVALAVKNRGRGLVVDAAMLTADEVSILFSFTRSYFHVDVRRPAALVAYLGSIMPRKPRGELYNAIGYHKHGKTELFRDLSRRIEGSTDRFELAPGERGMVMSVFTLPSFDVVFKVIRDRFAYPKSSTRRDVMDRYELVFKHDRAGRLADVQEFEHLAFPRVRFTQDLLDELAAEAAGTVTIGPTTVEFKHVYVERRMTPLNLFLREAPAAATGAAIVDYGQAVKDLAATNIFPGDLLLKNFGVTRHGRIVFYDYDELCSVTQCSFRELPANETLEEELSAEPWYYVGPTDVFPEEFIRFLGLDAKLRSAFLEAHADLLTARFWIDMQARLEAGEMVDILPYSEARRLHRS